MSRETMRWLNTMTLVSELNGKAWHYDAAEQGDESNHYPGFIPVADVLRRLFYWQAVSARVAVEIPATPENMTHLSDDGLPMRWAVQDDRQAMIHGDEHHVFGLFKDGYTAHQFAEWLIGGVSNILGDTVGITSAGLLKKGAVAWVQVGIPETLHMPDTGVRFRPNMLAGTSLDGSVATFYKRTVTNTVCDNTMAAAMGEIGQVYKTKHTRWSKIKLEDARAALNLLSQTADAFEDQVRALVQTTVTNDDWNKFLATYVPLEKDNEPLKGRSLTMATNKQDSLRRLWNHDERVSPWKGTAWGVVQAVNTWGQHEQIVRGAERAERNMLNAISGDIEKTDEHALKVLAGIIG